MEFQPPAVEEISEMFPQFEILETLGHGGMGAVYIAHQVSLDRPVAIKILPRQFGADPQFRASFEAEAKSMARLNHPNVVQIHDLGEDDEGYFLVMEYVAGCSVRELLLAALKAGRRLPPGVGICIVEQACRGAHAAHELTGQSLAALRAAERD